MIHLDPMYSTDLYLADFSACHLCQTSENPKVAFRVLSAQAPFHSRKAESQRNKESKGGTTEFSSADLNGGGRVDPPVILAEGVVIHDEVGGRVYIRTGASR